MREKFDVCNKIANNNLINKGNLSTFLVAYIDLARSLGKEDIALEEVTALPPAESFENPDKRVDMVTSICLDNMTLSNAQSMVR